MRSCSLNTYWIEQVMKASGPSSPAHAACGRLLKDIGVQEGLNEPKTLHLSDHCETDIDVIVNNQQDIFSPYQEYLRQASLSYKAFQRLGIASREGLIATKERLESLERSYGSSIDFDPNSLEIKKCERDLVGKKIPGFFHTPKDNARQMVAALDLPDDSAIEILEPEGGKGDIAEAIRERYPNAKLSVIEINPTLREILQLKGFNLVGHDFLDHESRYDAIVMNPPFEKGQDMDHVRHAFSLLKPGGQLVAIVSEGVFHRSDQKSNKFREWLDEFSNRDTEKLESGTFKMAGTMVVSRIVYAKKPDDGFGIEMDQDNTLAGLSL